MTEEQLRKMVEEIVEDKIQSLRCVIVQDPQAQRNRQADRWTLRSFKDREQRWRHSRETAFRSTPAAKIESSLSRRSRPYRNGYHDGLNSYEPNPCEEEEWAKTDYRTGYEDARKRVDPFYHDKDRKKDLNRASYDDLINSGVRTCAIVPLLNSGEYRKWDDVLKVKNVGGYAIKLLKRYFYIGETT